MKIDCSASRRPPITQSGSHVSQRDLGLRRHARPQCGLERMPVNDFKAQRQRAWGLSGLLRRQAQMLLHGGLKFVELVAASQSRKARDIQIAPQSPQFFQQSRR